MLYFDSVNPGANPTVAEPDAVLSGSVLFVRLDKFWRKKGGARMTENRICQSHDLDDLIFGPDSTPIISDR